MGWGEFQKFFNIFWHHYVIQNTTYVLVLVGLKTFENIEYFIIIILLQYIYDIENLSSIFGSCEFWHSVFISTFASYKLEFYLISMFGKCLNILFLFAFEWLLFSEVTYNILHLDLAFNRSIQYTNFFQFSKIPSTSHANGQKR